MKLALAFLTKDRVELTKRSVEPLLQHGNFDTHWFDGSVTPKGDLLPHGYRDLKGVYHNVRGGPDAAVAFVLTTLLNDPANYTHIGLCENDVLLHHNWFALTKPLFQRGADEGLPVGAVSARSYVDRILIQRDGYAVMHNLGFGFTILTRLAAQILLANMRTSLTIENRRVFMQLAGRDIGKYWAFRLNDHWLCADWGVDRVLAAHGLASLALVPSPVEMIGQDPPLAEQGLALTTEPFELLRDDRMFDHYAATLENIREGRMVLGDQRVHVDPGTREQMFFAHQMHLLGGVYSGNWFLKWSQGFGPFAWQAAGAGARLTAMVSGAVAVMLTGSEDGGQVLLEDMESGYKIDPVLPAGGQQLLHLVVPATVAHRRIRLTALSAGVIFYGMRVQEQQVLRDTAFDHTMLPPVA